MRYVIEGEPLPVVICDLESGETMITESGAMSWMSPNMKMETSAGGGIGKMLGRALSGGSLYLVGASWPLEQDVRSGRMFSGESMFQNSYTAQKGPGMIAFASSFPGSIRAFEIGSGKDLVTQKSAFLAATSGVELSLFFQKKIGGALFGGEGFIMQRLSGSGIAFVEFDGYVKEYTLAPGQQMVVDTGYLAAMDSSCSLDVRAVPGVKNMFFGGEGIFNTVVTGPGNIWIQTMPISQMANALRPFFPPSNH